MAFLATLSLDDDMNRIVSKEAECEATVLATAITDVAALVTDLAAVTTLGLVKVNYSEKDSSAAFAETVDSNSDTGATFRLLLSDDNIIAYKIPGFDQALADGAGNINPDGVEVQAYFDNFKAAGAFTVGRGRHVVTVISGSMDK